MYILYILLAIVILLLMVLIHEFGHYCIGRLLNFKITEFSVGFGKAIFSKTNKRGEKISLRIFPLGGYCAFAGENEEGEDEPDSFNNQAPWKRILVFLAGVTFNFVAAIIFSVILLCGVGYDIPKFTQSEVLNHVVSYQTSEKFDKDVNVFQAGDVVFAVNGTKIDFAYGENFSEAVSKALENLKNEEKDNANAIAAQSPTIVTIRRNGEMIEKEMYFTKVTYLAFDNQGNPIFEEDGKTQKKLNYYTLGGIVENGLEGEYSLLYPTYSPYKHSFIEAIERSIPFTFGLAFVVLKSLWMLITFQLGIDAIGGPITTIATIATVTQANAANILLLIPLISANLAVFNLLPIPALDGAHVVFTTVEWIRKKPLKRNVENIIHTVGLAVLFGLVIIVDILHFVL